MPRKRTPRTMDAPAKLWLIKTMRKNFWRVAHWYSFEDLIQDGLLCWHVVCVKYPKVREQRQLMALFKRTYLNHIHKLANQRTAQVLENSVDELPLTQWCDDTGRQLRQLISEAPEPLRLVLQLILRDPALLDKPCRRSLSGKRQTTNEWLCSLISLDPSRYDLREQLDQLTKA